MALIGKIRKNFWFVLILLGLALAAFVIMDVSSAAGLGGGQANLKLGEVNGQEINYRDFQRTEQIYFGNQGDPYTTRDNVWNYYVEKSIVDKESDKLGVTVSKDELMDLQFGSRMSPIMAQNWRNPQTGQIDRTQLNSFKTAIENNEELDPRFRDFWAEQEHQIIKFHKQNKITNLVSKAIYTPSWLAEKAYDEENAKVDFEYVKVPFDQVGDADIAIEDADYSNYLNLHKDRYTNKEETRTLEYVVFDVLPTDADREAIRQQMVTLNGEFAVATNDSLFAFSIQNMEIGQVVGPVEENNIYRNIKLLDKRLVPDTVTARHILRMATPGDAAGLARANNTIDSLLTLVRTGSERVDTLANRFSQDPGSNKKGGQLDPFVQETMLPEFKNACFVYGKEGGYYKVTTNVGVHLINVQDQKYLDRNPKYKLAFINKAIVPSTETQDRINEEVADLVASHPYLDDMRNVIAERGDVAIDRVTNIKANDYVFADLPSGNTSREIVRWAFNGTTDVNDMAPDVFIYTEPNLFYNNKYVLAGLKSIEPAGLRSVANAMDEIAPLIRNEKKGAVIADRLSGKGIEAAAAEYGVNIESASGVGFNANFVPSLGQEPNVIAQAFGSDLNSTSNAIVGNSGVFIVKPTFKAEAGQSANLPSFRTSNSNTVRGTVGQKLIDSMKKLANVEDSRFTFF